MHVLRVGLRGNYGWLVCGAIAQKLGSKLHTRFHVAVVFVDETHVSLVSETVLAGPVPVPFTQTYAIGIMQEGNHMELIGKAGFLGKPFETREVCCRRTSYSRTRQENLGWILRA